MPQRIHCKGCSECQAHDAHVARCFWCGQIQNTAQNTGTLRQPLCSKHLKLIWSSRRVAVNSKAMRSFDLLQVLQTGDRCFNIVDWVEAKHAENYDIFQPTGKQWNIQVVTEIARTVTWSSSTWGRGWMTKASGVGERRKGRGELRRDCHHRVAALFVPTRMQQWYIDIWYITMIYMGEGAGGPFRVKKHVMSLGSPGILAKARRL